MGKFSLLFSFQYSPRSYAESFFTNLAGESDEMVWNVDGVYHAYSTITERNAAGDLVSYVKLKTSTDLRSWGEFPDRLPGWEGQRGSGCLRASSTTFKTCVYRSKNPTLFADHHDLNSPGSSGTGRSINSRRTSASISRCLRKIGMKPNGGCHRSGKA